MPDIALKNLLHDRLRFMVTLLGVTISVIMMFAQIGIYLGFMQNASIIIDNTPADIWITSKNSSNFDFPLPFTEGKLHKVKEVPGKPGAYRAISYLRPHFQLDELDVSLRLVADLPAPKQQ